jgi:hypothetical protein
MIFVEFIDDDDWSIVLPYNQITTWKSADQDQAADGGCRSSMPRFASAAPECRYVVVDADGPIALLGVLFPREDLTFAVELDIRLPAGHYIVMAEIRVNGNAMNPEIERIPVVIGGKP